MATQPSDASSRSHDIGSVRGTFRQNKIGLRVCDERTHRILRFNGGSVQASLPDPVSANLGRRND
jgi:hypothetical protein